MKVLVDGVIYSYQNRGGISRIYSEILPRLCELDSSLDMHLLVDHHLRQSPPVHRQLHVHGFANPEWLLRPSRLWMPVRQAVRSGIVELVSRPFRDSVWHSTYYTYPPSTYRGPTIVAFYDMIVELLPELFSSPWDTWFRQRKRRCVQRFDRVMCISHTTAADVCAFYNIGRDSIRVAPLAASPTFRPLLKEQISSNWLRPKPFVLYVGQRASYKGFGCLLKAYARWPARDDFELVVVGPEMSEGESKVLSDLGLRSRITMLGHVSDDQLCALYNQASAFIYPSRYEGFGIPILEALACGCPVVASRIPSTLEVANDIPTYFVTDDADSLIEALSKCVYQGRTRERVEQGIRQAATYSWDRTAHETLQVYRELTHETPV